ncbi:hypothetical protein P4O66_010057 [Electrophorus voltai]|uniref:Uncharacterized protein n=1 Tax=Electrophorus voltai TaxID=2609070 RepID=A0AAD8ZBF6_9TELE|nr:hypothetical protein P4O66_010057 [Electrophorus voltai]
MLFVIHHAFKLAFTFSVQPGTYGTMSAVMGVRFLSSWKVMPAGLIAGASLLMILRLGVGFLQTKKNA